MDASQGLSQAGCSTSTLWLGSSTAENSMMALVDAHDGCAPWQLGPPGTSGHFAPDSLASTSGGQDPAAPWPPAALWPPAAGGAAQGAAEACAAAQGHVPPGSERAHALSEGVECCAAERGLGCAGSWDRAFEPDDDDKGYDSEGFAGFGRDCTVQGNECDGRHCASKAGWSERAPGDICVEVGEARAVQWCLLTPERQDGRLAHVAGAHSAARAARALCEGVESGASSQLQCAAHEAERELSPHPWAGALQAACARGQRCASCAAGATQAPHPGKAELMRTLAAAPRRWSLAGQPHVALSDAGDGAMRKGIKLQCKQPPMRVSMLLCDDTSLRARRAANRERGSEARQLTGWTADALEDMLAAARAENAAARAQLAAAQADLRAQRERCVATRLNAVTSAGVTGTRAPRL
jgi:hypothetical protein